MFHRIVLEGTDGIGKSVVAHHLREFGVTCLDRHPDFSKAVVLPEDLESEHIGSIRKLVESSEDTLFVIFIYEPGDGLVEEEISEAISGRSVRSPYDELFDSYNESYVRISEAIGSLPNVLVLVREKTSTPFVWIQRIMRRFIEGVDYGSLRIKLEGESKIYRKLPGTNLAFATLKPTIYSFTFKRYAEVPGSEVVRNQIWGIIAGNLNEAYSRFAVKGEGIGDRMVQHYASELLMFKRDLMVSNFVIPVDERTSLVLFEKEIPNIEVVWKKRHVGTPKHKLIGVEGHSMLNGHRLHPGDPYPSPIVRFDWRNPIIHDGERIVDVGDECIPDDFARFYINTDHAKVLARFVSEWLTSFFRDVGLELVDICYFMNHRGDRVHSEISPDGMRLYATEDYSFDKDLWRSGAPKEVVLRRWNQLLDLLMTREGVSAI